jgi:hypothetical protein
MKFFVFVKCGIWWMGGCKSVLRIADCNQKFLFAKLLTKLKAEGFSY